ncbi:MAG: T9SS type A sorting domain-containing protein [Bacteroidales bacterium]|nr:T9SS type A sorting domain-containing protein [Bacteroidales bacterium]MCF8399512.1 T9SS type A sorting domain-containing protein [Bacteroidales bacterium]
MKNSRQHIGANKVIAVMLLFALCCYAPLLAAQISVTLGQDYTCSNEEALLPVSVQNFENIGAFTFYLSIDTSKVNAIEIQNVHEDLLMGDIASNLIKAEQKFIISWWSMQAVNLQDDRILDIRLVLNDENTEIAFLNECEVAYSDLSLVENVQYTDGDVKILDELSVAPEVNSVEEGTMVNFSLPDIPGIQYQWQEKISDEWKDLEDSESFNGVHSKTLNIVSVPLDFDDRHYRCLLSSAYCSAFSGEATLEVSVGIDQHHQAETLLEIYPNPVSDIVHVHFNDTKIDKCFLTLVNAQGILINEYRFLKNASTVETIDLSRIPAGLYALQLKSENRLIGITKLIKK